MLRRSDEHLSEGDLRKRKRRPFVTIFLQREISRFPIAWGFNWILSEQFSFFLLQFRSFGHRVSKTKTTLEMHLRGGK